MTAKGSGLQLRFIILFSGITLIAVLAVAAVRFILNKQAEDAQFIVLSGQQSILTQRIFKLSLLIERDVATHQYKPWRTDTLSAALDNLRNLHYKLLDQSKTHHNSLRTDSLLRSSTPYFESTFVAGRRIVSNNDLATIGDAVTTIAENDKVLVLSTQRILDSYQHHSDGKLRDFKISLGVVSALSSLAVFVTVLLIFRPLLSRLARTNKALSRLNGQLQSSYQELQATEEENRGNMDNIQTLQEHLGAKEKQYRELVENANDIIYELDENARFTYVNPTTEFLTAFTKEELIGKPYWKLVHPDYKKEVSDFYIKQVKEKQERSYYEFPIRTANNSLIWLGQSAYLTFDEDGWVPKANVVARDITLLRQTQEKLEQSERLYRLISNNSMDLISLYASADNNPVRIYVSPSVKEILGYEQEELIGRSPYDFMHPDDAQRKRENVLPVILSGKPAQMEYRAYKKDGTLIWMESTLKPYFDDHGKLAGFQTSAHDITERKLAGIVINSAKEKAEEASIAKSQFLSMMSHEIRTPMNAVIGLANFLLEENPREGQLKHLQLLKFSGESLLTIINDILDFSKIEAGKIVIECVPVRIKPFLNNIVLPMKMRANEKGILLQLKLDERIPEVITGDPVRISQVINNLLSNAIKFTKTGSVCLTVEQNEVRGNMHQITFRVKDTGIGIEHDKIDFIFDSFAQANTDTTRKFGGTGLGLTITKKLLQLMDSDIHVESKPGSGSEFIFTLSVQESTSAAHEEYTDHSSGEHTGNMEKACHVLLAEDNEVNQIVVMNYLEKWGYKVSIANNGKEVVRLIQQRCFHLVLIDLQMPEMDGYQATQLIREMDDAYFKSVPIIALTASAMTDVPTRLTGIGMNDYISKPFKPRELADKIVRHCLREIPGDTDRTLQSSLDAYSGGNQDVNLDLARRMIQNISDLQTALQRAVEHNDIDAYVRTSHKMRTTISILRNEQFTSGLEEVKQALLLRKETAEQLATRVESFNFICKRKIEELTDFYVSALS